MTSRIVLRPQARAEVEAAREWYEQQAPGLGSRFVSALDDSLLRLAEQPLAHACVSGDLRRAHLRRFPYAVFFRTRGDEVVVVAVMHGRRHPQRWRSRR